MTDLTLGQRPPLLRVLLTPSSPFVAALVIAEVTGTFEEIPVLRFELPDGTEISWSSFMSADSTQASWSVSSAQVNALITASRSRKVRLTYGTRTWMNGRFEVDGVW